MTSEQLKAKGYKQCTKDNNFIPFKESGYYTTIFTELGAFTRRATQQEITEQQYLQHKTNESNIFSKQTNRKI